MFLTNELKSTCIRQQKSGDPTDGYIVRWDYHVIFILKEGHDARVYDQDSRLDWGCDFPQYYDKALKTKSGEIRTLFRLVPAKIFLENFASNRSHMLTVVAGKQKYTQPPPPTKPIVNVKGETMTLP